MKRNLHLHNVDDDILGPEVTFVKVDSTFFEHNQVKNFSNDSLKTASDRIGVKIIFKLQAKYLPPFVLVNNPIQTCA